MLLIFLILVLDVKITIKVIAIILFLVVNRKFFVERKIFRQRFTWFYFSMITIGVLNLGINISGVPSNYLIVSSLGILLWLLCAAAAFINLWIVETTDLHKLHRTITLFFVINALVTLIQLIFVMSDAGSLNPFIYQGMHQKYFVNTGDLMKGISFDFSTTNAILNSFAVVYFLYRNKTWLLLPCMLSLLLTTSNFTNALLAVTLILLFIFRSTRNQKSVILVCLVSIVVFIAKISPTNNRYIKHSVENILPFQATKISEAYDYVSLLNKPHSELSDDEKKKKIAILYLDSVQQQVIKNKLAKGETIVSEKKPFIRKPSIHSEPFQRIKNRTPQQQSLLLFAVKNFLAFDTTLEQIRSWHLPGKLIASEQTIHFLKNHPAKILLGDGMGNFSSRLAFRAAGLHIDGYYPEKFAYINKDFLNNHLHLYLSYFTKDAELHSIINSAHNTYDQVLSEYGLAGLFCFIFFYLGYFINRMKSLSYGIPLLILLTGALGIEYWFEQLSIIIIFELLMLINIKESDKQYA